MSLLISVPCYGQVETEFWKSTLMLHENLIINEIPFEWNILSGDSNIVRARNTLVAYFLKTNFEFMLFLDSDLKFSPMDVNKLYQLDVPFSCAAYAMKRPDRPLSAWENGSLVTIHDKTKPFKVDYAGTGFMLLHRSVFKKMIASYPELACEESHGDNFAFFNMFIHNNILLSEDYSFCQRWTDIGGEILLDPTIKLTHYGTYGYTGEDTCPTLLH